MSIQTTIEEPAVLTANTYFWTPGGNASSRRRAEAKHQGAVRQWLISLGFVEITPGVYQHLETRLLVSFSYNESCRNVYKRLEVRYPDGRRGNILAIRKLASSVQH